MKTKVMFWLSLCLFVSSIMGFVLSRGQPAEAAYDPHTVPTWVRLDEDFMRHHGLNIKSYCSHVGTSPVDIATVPSDTRFIITDIMSTAMETHYQLYLHDANTGEKRGYARLSGITLDIPCYVSLRSGIVFEAGEIIRVSHSSTGGHFVTISGYFVDL